ncbi:hypothetical protein N0V90_007101 [Kalmusia sp. IMI 367209]|nr:hypothetical protein N0V90_007101 [Kalmusia sp. IMI 367209]
MSANGDTPMYYDGWHQTDVLRAKALARLKQLTKQDDPWFLAIAPTSPHVQGGHAPIPLERHKKDFEHLQVPKPKNFNPPDDDLQANKPSYIGKLKMLPPEDVKHADFHYKSRIRAIQGLDEIVHDVVDHLQNAGQLENTYIIYTSDNGYHIGTHRLFAGKSLPYIEDTNIPMIVRGPGVPKGATSKIASTHIDFAPTFLDIAGVPEVDRPQFFDGRSMLGEWKMANSEAAAQNVDREIINVEFWGHLGNELKGGTYANNSYKTMRIVSEDSAWLYSRWCTGDTELYDTKSDPYELYNLAQKPVSHEHRQMMNRLNALLLVTKSCVGPTCRDPWPVLKPANDSLPPAQSLADAMDSKYDDFFASFPPVTFKECIDIQLPSNELPFYPPEAEHKLGLAHRKPTDNYDKGLTGGDCKHDEIKANGHFGTKEQRDATLEQINKDARKLKDDELPGPNCHQIGIP